MLWKFKFSNHIKTYLYFMNSIETIREALQFSPENIPLRLHLAELLLAEKVLDEAEEEFRFVLDLSEKNDKAKYGLARIYFEQQKYSTAGVILEELCKSQDASAAQHLLLAKVLFKENNKEQSFEHYKKAIERDALIFDQELDSAFRMPAGNGSEGDGGQYDDYNEEDLGGRFLIEKPDVNFGDVGGMESVKDEIRIKIIQPMQHPELYAAYGKKAGGGILLYGPPGCGKTHIARATAGEVNARFINVGINEILDMWIGNSEKNLHDVFEFARQHAPCVLFFDEVDALGANRSDMKNSTGRHLINQFLSELDGLQASNEGVLILAATNAPWHLDPAFRRPGRFDRIIFVPPPDELGREQIMKILLKDKPTESLQLAEVLKRTRDFSGADLKAVIELVIEEKLRVAFTTGKPEPIYSKDLANSASKISPSTKEWFTIARNYALYSNESGLYDTILQYLGIKK